jgi:hypothetical protein
MKLLLTAFEHMSGLKKSIKVKFSALETQKIKNCNMNNFLVVKKDHTHSDT